MTVSASEGAGSGPLWGGRFASAPAPELSALSRTEERAFDMAPYDVAASLAHVRQLERVGMLTTDERATVSAALSQMADEYVAGTLRPEASDEDVHGFLERVLRGRVGSVAGKVRAGRSRNDQAATHLRLYLRDHGRTVHDRLLDLIGALVEQAERNADTITSGFTHLQPAQPILFAHQLLAHAQILMREVTRLHDWDARTAYSPLGAGALAGSAAVTHPEEIAAELGFAGPVPNSIDAVGSRDHVAEFLFVASAIGVDLSRLAEEVTLWVSAQFQWAALDDSWSTGSSIMPQKKNPDIAELTRGKAARLLGGLVALMGSLKGLPLAYNRDVSEDKHAAIDAVDTLLLTLPAMTGLVRTLRFNAERMARDATAGFTLATELADWLSERGVPFSEAHEIAGHAVRLCESRGIGLDDLTPADLSSIDARLTADVLSALDPRAAIARRANQGGTAPVRVREQLEALRARCDDAHGWSAGYRGPRVPR